MATLPTPDIVADVLSKLLRRPVHVKPVPFKAGVARLSGTYCSGPLAAVAICMTDIALAAYCAAAFTLIPANAARDSIKANLLDENLEDIFGEVLNVLSSVFTTHGSQRITLESKSSQSEGLTELAKQALLASDKKLDLEVEVDGYGKGLMMLRLL